jgi:methionyl aminopeptidase
MLNVGRAEVEVLKDGWTAVTEDRSLSAHFELSVAVTERGPGSCPSRIPTPGGGHA